MKQNVCTGIGDRGLMDVKHNADPMEILVNELKGLGGMEPVLFASRFKGQGALSQAYRNLLAARTRQSRIFRRFHRRESTSPVRGASGKGDPFYGERYIALERKASDSLIIIRNSDVP
jgi:hypothetical protein